MQTCGRTHHVRISAPSRNECAYAYWRRSFDRSKPFDIIVAAPSLTGCPDFTSLLVCAEITMKYLRFGSGAAARCALPDVSPSRGPTPAPMLRRAGMRGSAIPVEQPWPFSDLARVLNASINPDETVLHDISRLSALDRDFGRVVANRWMSPAAVRRKCLPSTHPVQRG